MGTTIFTENFYNMKKLFSILTLAFAITACNNDTSSEPQLNGEETGTSTMPVAGDSIATGMNCYAYINNKDTVRLQYEVKNEKVTGKLSYNYFEKDKSSGTISGYTTPSGIVADYTFQAEGTTSVREVVFKKVGDDMVEGFGEIRQDGEKPVFADKNSLKYDPKLTLSKMDCQ